MLVKQKLVYSNCKKRKRCSIKTETSWKNTFPSNFVKCHGINIDENLNWMSQISDIAIKLNKSNAILFKLRHFIDSKSPKSIYHAIFVPHLYCFSIVWTQNWNSIKRLFFKRNPYELYISSIIMIIYLLYLENLAS